MVKARLHVANVLEEGVFGGPQRRSVEVARALVADVETLVDTTIVVPAAADELRRSGEEAGVSLFEVPMTALSRRPDIATRYLVRFVPEVAALRRALRELDVDLVHVSGGSFCLKGPFASRLAGIPFVWTLNDAHAGKAVRTIARLTARLTRPIGFHFAAHAVRRHYRRFGEDGLAWVIPSPHRSGMVEQVSASSADPYTDAGPFRILMLANINPIKGIDIAVEAMAQLPTGTASLHVAGATKETQVAYRQRLAARVSELAAPVHFVGPVHDVVPWLKHADAYLCASRSEASPLAVWEAAAAGLPVISTDVGDVARELPDRVASLIVGVEDAEAVSAAVRHLLADNSLCASLGREAQQRMVERTSPASVASMTAAMYHEAVDAAIGAA